VYVPEEPQVPDESSDAPPGDRGRRAADYVGIVGVLMLFATSIFLSAPDWALMGWGCTVGLLVVLAAAFLARVSATPREELGGYVETALTLLAVWALFKVAIFHRETAWGQAVLWALLVAMAVVFARRFTRVHRAFRQ
jgi:hypothetical protein